MSTIKERVGTDKEALAGADRPALVTWANEHGVTNRSAWGRYKRALKEVVGVDFDAMRQADKEAQRQATAAAATRRLVLYSDAKASAGRYAICGPDGEPAWHGRFFDGDRDFDGEQSSGEMAAAKKAVWLASKVSERLGEPVALELRVDAEWLCWATSTDGRGGKALGLGRAADRLGIALNVVHVPGTENPADRYTVGRGYLRWQDAIDGLIEHAEAAARRDAAEAEAENDTLHM